MKIINKNVLVPYQAEQIFDLVNDIENYPKFLPWCSKTEILNTNQNSVDAVMHIDYLKIHHSFSTHNDICRPTQIKMHLINGPFKSLEGYWNFTPIDNIGCKIDFCLKYEFTSHILSALIAPVFNLIADSMVDAFIKEADKRYDE